MLQLSPPEDAPAAPADQVVVLGRYRLPADAARVHGLRWSVSLFGSDRSERQFRLRVTRGSQAQDLLLTPDQADAAVLPSRAGDLAGPARRALVPAVLGLAVLAGLWRGLRGWPGRACAAQAGPAPGPSTGSRRSS